MYEVYLPKRLANGIHSKTIVSESEQNKVFGSPSAWAIHCKKIVNPMKKSGCGWASVSILSVFHFES